MENNKDQSVNNEHKFDFFAVEETTSISSTIETKIIEMYGSYQKAEEHLPTKNPKIKNSVTRTYKIVPVKITFPDYEPEFMIGTMGNPSKPFCNLPSDHPIGQNLEQKILDSFHSGTWFREY